MRLFGLCCFHIPITPGGSRRERGTRGQGPLQVLLVLSEQGLWARARGETPWELLINSFALNALFPNCSLHPKEGGDKGLTGPR